MIKFFKKNDTIDSDFTVSTNKIANTVLSDILVGIDSNGDVYPIDIVTDGCDNNFAGSCELIEYETNIAVTPNERSIDFQYGKFITGSIPFYTSDQPDYISEENPVNIDGSYKRQVYNSVKKLYYNDYNNSYNIFGFDGFDTSKAKLQLSDEFIVLNLKITDTGDKILPGSIRIQNQSGDIVADIFDDSNNNLFLSGSYFIDKYIFKSDSRENITNYGLSGASTLIQN
jgi:hypothetical protein